MTFSVNLTNFSIDRTSISFSKLDKNDDGKVTKEELAIHARSLLQQKAKLLEESNKAKTDLTKLLGGGMGPMAAMLPIILGDDNPLLKSNAKSNAKLAEANALDGQIALFVKLAVGGTGGASLIGNEMTEQQFEDFLKDLADNDLTEHASANRITAKDFLPLSTRDLGTTFTTGGTISQDLLSRSGQETTNKKKELDMMSLLKPMLGPMGALLDLFLDEDDEEKVYNIDSATKPEPDLMELLLPMMFGGGAAAGPNPQSLALSAGGSSNPFDMSFLNGGGGGGFGAPAPAGGMDPMMLMMVAMMGGLGKD